MREFEICLNSDKLSVSNLNSFLFEKVGRKMRLYNFYGIEIIDDSDIDIYLKEKNKVIFFTKCKHKNKEKLVKYFRTKISFVCSN